MTNSFEPAATTAIEMLRYWPGFSTVSQVMSKFVRLQLYLAGGVIRDVVLHRRQLPRDFDIFLDGPSVDQALNFLSLHGDLRTTPFGSPRWFPKADSQQYCDFVPIARFTNGLQKCEGIVDALKQFDFTGNAMAVNLRTGKFFDPVCGSYDMQRRIMRMVVDYPDEPIAPGAVLSRIDVLWFRLLHYAATLGLQIEPATKRWLIKHRVCEQQVNEFSTAFFAPHTRYLRPLSGDVDE